MCDVVIGGNLNNSASDFINWSDVLKVQYVRKIKYML